MKPSDLMQANADKTYNNAALNGAHLKANYSSSISPWFLAFAAVSALTIAVVLVFGITQNVKQTYSAAPEVAQEKTSLKASEYMEAFVWTSKLKLEDLKLNHRLQVSVGSANNLVVKGSISKQETDNWKAFLGWYESREGFPTLNHSVETNATSSNIPELKSVWFDIKPTAYFSDGRSGNVGTSFEDGWKIVSIQTWAVFIERNGTKIMLQY